MKKTYEVVAAVIEKNNKFFCAQRAKDDRLQNKWEFPGGKINLGETKEQALQREIVEELGVVINIQSYITTIYHEYYDFKVILHAFLCNTNDDVTLYEHQDYKWLTKEELKTLDWAEADLPIVCEIMKS